MLKAFSTGVSFAREFYPGCRIKVNKKDEIITLRNIHIGGNDTIKLYVHRNQYNYRISQQPDKITAPELSDPIDII